MPLAEPGDGCNFIEAFQEIFITLIMEVISVFAVYVESDVVIPVEPKEIRVVSHQRQSFESSQPITIFAVHQVRPDDWCKDCIYTIIKEELIQLNVALHLYIQKILHRRLSWVFQQIPSSGSICGESAHFSPRRTDQASYLVGR